MEQYKHFLESLELNKILKISYTNTSRAIQENIIKTVFYDQQENETSPSNNIFFGNKFSLRFGKFEDYLILSNLDSASKYLINLIPRKIQKSDIINLRHLILKDCIRTNALDQIFDSYGSNLDFRQSAHRSYIAERVGNGQSELKDISKLLNKEVTTPEENFLNAMNFHSKLVKLHIFPDGNGRTAKIFTNFYLLKNRLSPIIIDSNNKQNYYDTLNVNHFSKYPLPFVATMLCISSVGKKDQLISKIKQLRSTDPYAIEFKDVFLALTNNISKEELAKDINCLHKTGPNFALGALWLASQYKIDTEAIKENFDHPDSRVRAMCIFTMAKVGPNKYESKLISAALYDKDQENRVLAISELSRLRKLNLKLANNIFKNEKNEKVLVSLIEAIRACEPSNAYANITKKMMKDRRLSIRLRAHCAFVIHADTKEVVGLLKNFPKEPAILCAVGETIYKSKKVMEEDVITLLLEKTRKDKCARKVILSWLAKRDIGPYKLELDVDFCNKILENEGSTAAEKGFSKYILYKIPNNSLLRGNNMIELSNSNSYIENIAIFIRKIDLIKNEAMQIDENQFLDLFKFYNEKLAVVQISEMMRLVKSGALNKNIIQKTIPKFNEHKKVLRDTIFSRSFVDLENTRNYVLNEVLLRNTSESKIVSKKSKQK